jgi:hypothetical protein
MLRMGKTDGAVPHEAAGGGRAVRWRGGRGTAQESHASVEVAARRGGDGNEDIFVEG